MPFSLSTPLHPGTESTENTLDRRDGVVREADETDNDVPHYSL